MVRLRHVGITVFDLGRSLKLYRDILGFKVIEQKRIKGEYIENLHNVKGIEMTYVKLKSPNTKILLELWQFHSFKPTIRGLSHIALTVTNLDELYKILLKEINFVSPPILSPDSPVKVCFAHDYDSNIIEFVEEIK